MPVSGNALAKYLVMFSQVVAWCTVSVMLLRRGLNQVNAVAPQPSSAVSATATAYDAVDFGNATTTIAAGHRHQEATTTTTTTTTTKPFDDSGKPAVVAGIVMITIAVIMLIISPTIMLIKMIDKRNNRILDAELESPPKYEDVVESAPRYSSLFVFNNDGEMALLPENKHKDKDNIQKQVV